jgi:Raf kinase inhibitor-like YbhB/YbcL family protein
MPNVPRRNRYLGNRYLASTCAFLALAALSACGSDDKASTPATTTVAPATTTTAPATKIVVTSTAFVDNGPIPSRYTCEAGNAVVPVAWTGIPDNAVSVALVVHDPDAPLPGGFLHWLVLGLPPSDGSIPPVPVTARQLANGAGQPLWTGPCPPAGPLHHYRFTVYALNKDVQTQDEIAAATIAQGTLVGTYRR